MILYIIYIQSTSIYSVFGGWPGGALALTIFQPRNMLASFKQQGFQVEQNGLLGYEKPLESAWGFACPQIIENDSESMEAYGGSFQGESDHWSWRVRWPRPPCSFLLLLAGKRRPDSCWRTSWPHPFDRIGLEQSENVGMTPQRDNCLWYGTNMEYVMESSQGSLFAQCGAHNFRSPSACQSWWPDVRHQNLHDPHSLDQVQEVAYTADSRAYDIIWHPCCQDLPRFAKTHAEWPENPDLWKPRPCRSARPQGLLLLGAMGSHGLSWFSMMWTWCCIIFHHLFIFCPYLPNFEFHLAAKNCGPPRLGTLLEGSDCFMAFFLVQASMDCHNLPCVARMDLVTRFNDDDLWLYIYL